MEGSAQEAIARLGAATMEVLSMLQLDGATADRLRELARQTAASTEPPEKVIDVVREIRYLLVEAADGPIAAFLADSAARIIGDDIGKLFR